MAEVTKEVCDLCAPTRAALATEHVEIRPDSDKRRKYRRAVCGRHLSMITGMKTDGDYTCKECGQDCVNPQGLGAHRAATGHKT